MVSEKAKGRIPGIDGIRVLATISVFLFHCLHVFDPIWFHINNRETSMAYFLVVMFLFFWIMPLFFMVAGFSSCFSMSKRTSGEYVKERFSRLVLPFLIGAPLLTLPQILLQGIHYGDLHHGFSIMDLLTYWVDSFSGWQVFRTPGVFGSLGHHLWFLIFLFLYSVIFQPLFRLISRKLETPFLSRFFLFFRKPQRLLLFVLPMTIIYTLLRKVSFGYSEWADFVYWAFFYFLGFLLAVNKHYINRIGKGLPVFAVIGVLSFAGMLLVTQLTDFTYYENPDYSLLSFVNHFFWVASGVSLSLCIMSLGFRFFRKPVNRKIRANLMPFYVLHQPVVLALAFFIVQPDWNLYLKSALLIGTSFIATSGLALIFPRLPFLRTITGQGRSLTTGRLSRVPA